MSDATPKLLAAAVAALTAAGAPQSAGELVAAMAANTSWTSASKTPAATVSAALYVDIRTHGSESLFVKAGPGLFGLRGRDPESDAPSRSSSSQASHGESLVASGL